ncbi:MAG TPA: hypothetical protein VK603_13725 [Candidatus Saccharimonadales bacterium]|nr:hypothetical protein [Candidatus Saccharimonadales bacterium]
MFHADFGMIDDHEIVSILGRDKIVQTSEILPLIGEYAIEHNGRFRPAYYVLRILEAYFVGGNPVLWYANRLLLALLSALFLYLGLRVFLRPLFAGLVTLLFFAGAQNEIWTRLGPQESYGVPLMLAGLAWVAVQLGRHNWHPARLFPGLALLAVAGFLKESFIPVLPGALAFIYVVLPIVRRSIFEGPRRLKLVDIFALAFLTVSLAAQVWLTVRALRDYSHQYAADVSTTSFLYALKPMLLAYSRDNLWFVPLIAGFATLLPVSRQQWLEHGWRKELAAVITLSATGVFLILGPQSMVYGGDIIFEGRYLTPGNLFVVFTAALGFYLLANHSKREHMELRGFITGMLLSVALVKVFHTHADANVAVLSTHKFQAKITEIVQLKTQYPELPLLFCSTNVFDREPIVSTARFLAAKMPKLERPFLEPFAWEKQADSPRTPKLARIMREESLEGDRSFAKIADFHGDNGRCIAVIFTNVAGNCPCEHTVRALGT